MHEEDSDGEVCRELPFFVDFTDFAVFFRFFL